MTILHKPMSNSIAAVLLVLALAAPSAYAARGDREADQGDVGRQDQLWPRNQRASGQDNSAAKRDAADAQQRGQRLSPDERRELRRDIRDAGREIYPRRR